MTRGPIYKYLLGYGTTNIPAGKILDVGGDPAMTADLPCVWIELDPDHLSKPMQPLTFYGTGMHPDDGDVHIGSCVVGPLAWHVYHAAPETPEKPEKPEKPPADDDILDELATNYYLYADRQFVHNTSTKTREWLQARRNAIGDDE